MKITRDVIGIFGEQCFKIVHGRSGIALIGAFHRQPVAREGVLRMGGKEFLEQGASRFLRRWSHRVRWVSARKRVL